MRNYMLQHLSLMEGALCKRTDAALIDLSERIIGVDLQLLSDVEYS